MEFDSVQHQGVAQLERHRLRSALRCRLAPDVLDTALAGGADPWSSRALMTRAARLCSLRWRRRIGAGLLGLVEEAERPSMVFSTRMAVRRREIIRHRDELIALGCRLGEPAPVRVAALAELSLLLSDGASPVYVGGRPPSNLAHTMSKVVWALEPAPSENEHQ
jgi:hypothetical protein